MGKIDNVKNFVRKVARFGLYIPVTNLILTYGQRLFSAKALSCMVAKRTRKIQDILSQSVAFPTELEDTSILGDGKEAPIWFFWLQGEDKLPLIPRLCLESIRKHANGHKVQVLSDENYAEFVQIPANLIEKYHAGRIKAAHFADILRVNILAQQGGLWLDATMLVTEDLPQSIFDAPFYSVKTKNCGYFVSQCRWAVFCLGAKKGHSLFCLLASLFEQYLTKTDVFVDYFLFDNFIDMIYERYPCIREEIDKVPFNNPSVHELASLLCEEVEADEIDRILDKTFLFKLSYKSYTPAMLLQNEENLYHKLQARLYS